MKCMETVIQWYYQSTWLSSRLRKTRAHSFCEIVLYIFRISPGKAKPWPRLLVEAASLLLELLAMSTLEESNIWLSSTAVTSLLALQSFLFLFPRFFLIIGSTCPPPPPTPYMDRKMSPCNRLFFLSCSLIASDLACGGDQFVVVSSCCVKLPADDRSLDVSLLVHSPPPSDLGEGGSRDNVRLES